MVTVIFRSEQ